MRGAHYPRLHFSPFFNLNFCAAELASDNHLYFHQLCFHLNNLADRSMPLEHYHQLMQGADQINIFNFSELLFCPSAQEPPLFPKQENSMIDLTRITCINCQNHIDKQAHCRKAVTILSFQSNPY
jgi:hypothetical protein